MLEQVAKSESPKLLAKEETLSRNDLNELMDKKIRTITRLAYDHNQFLHGLFQAAGMNPHNDISGRSDLIRAYKKGVRTSGSDIEKCYADYASQVPVIEVWSSGSSGEPKKVWLSRDDMEQQTCAGEKSFIAAGVFQGHRVLRFSAPPPHATSYESYGHLFFKNLAVRTLVFRLPTMPKRISQEEKERIALSYVNMIYGFNPHHVRGGNFALFDFANYLMVYGLRKERLDVKSAIFAGEPTTEEDRKAIGKLWNAEPFDVYASSELGTMSYECHSHSGMHIDESDLFLTSVDPEVGEEVNKNEQGKDLCTTLYQDSKLPGTFFINYSHGDDIAILNDGCSCGNRFKLSTHPTRKTKKKLISGFGFDVREKQSILKRASRKIQRNLR